MIGHSGDTLGFWSACVAQSPIQNGEPMISADITLGADPMVNEQKGHFPANPVR
jgi:hypothetical protein